MKQSYKWYKWNNNRTNGSVSYEVPGYLTGPKTARELWQTFEHVFASSAQSRVTELGFNFKQSRKTIYLSMILYED